MRVTLGMNKKNHKKMRIVNFKGFTITAEFNGLFDIRNDMGLLESENHTSIKECKELIKEWTEEEDPYWKAVRENKTDDETTAPCGR